MGKTGARNLWEKEGTLTGSGLSGMRENQGAFRETVGALPPKDVTIQDGAITGFEEAALIVDTEGSAAADDLNVISDVISATEKLHPGMLITLRAKDPARVVTVKNSAAANGINTADGNDIVLSPDWSLTLRLVGGRWYEERGRSSALADAAQSTANDAKSVTDKVTPTPTPNAIPQADADGDVWGLAKKNMGNLTQAGTTAIAHNAKPSERKVDYSMTWGTPYTAPADGSFNIFGTATATTQARLEIYAPDGTTLISRVGGTVLNGTIWGVEVPLRKGDKCKPVGDAAVSGFRFIYDQGAY